MRKTSSFFDLGGKTPVLYVNAAITYLKWKLKAFLNDLTALKNGGDNASNRFKYTCLCKHIIKGGLLVVEVVKTRSLIIY